MPVRLLLVLAMLAPSSGRWAWCDPGAIPAALLAAMLAIKSSELRSLRDARSLLGFALFSPFAAFLLDQGPLTTAGRAGRGQRAARPATPGQDEGHAGRLPAAARRRPPAGDRPAAGTGLLLAVPAPGHAAVGCSRARGGYAGAVRQHGARPVAGPDGRRHPALRVQFFGAYPSPQRYWRGPVLTAFDGRRWTRDRASERRPGRGRGRPQGWDYQIDYEPTDRRQLVALDLPSRAPAGSTLDADMSLSSERSLASLSRWRLHSAPPQRFDSTLSPYLRRRAAAAPASIRAPPPGAAMAAGGRR
jgi:hypothetical protein